MSYFLLHPGFSKQLASQSALKKVRLYKLVASGALGAARISNPAIELDFEKNVALFCKVENGTMVENGMLTK